MKFATITSCKKIRSMSKSSYKWKPECPCLTVAGHSIEVFSPVASEQQELPESFMVHGNYPNRFQKSTHLVVDLPWSTTLNVERFDVMGQRVLSPPPVNLTAGWGRSIRLESTALPSGLYLYRVRANLPVGIHGQASRFLRVR